MSVDIVTPALLVFLKLIFLRMAFVPFGLLSRPSSRLKWSSPNYIPLPLSGEPDRLVHPAI